MSRFLIAYYAKYGIASQKIVAKDQKEAIRKAGVLPHNVLAISKIKF